MLKDDDPRDLQELLPPTRTADVESRWSRLQVTWRQSQGSIKDINPPVQFWPSCGCHKWEVHIRQSVQCTSASGDLQKLALLSSTLFPNVYTGSSF